MKQPGRFDTFNYATPQNTILSPEYLDISFQLSSYSIVPVMFFL